MSRPTTSTRRIHDERLAVVCGRIVPHGTLKIGHDLEELAELLLAELCPRWDTIIRIEVFRVNPTDPDCGVWIARKI
jgi:hypothetical protein